MKLNTRMLGNVDVQEEEIIQFPQGLPGFEELRGFVLLKPEEDIPFHFLQSVEEEQLSFILTNPFWFYKAYEFSLPSAAKDTLQLADAQQLGIWSITTIRGALEEATLNLQAPVLINTMKRIGVQVILHDTVYHTRHPMVGSNKANMDTEGGGR